MKKIIISIAIGVGVISCIGVATKLPASADTLNSLSASEDNKGNMSKKDEAGINKKGWIESSNGLWSYSDDGQALATKKWIEDNGNWYYFDENSVMKTGWLNNNGTWYYFNNNGTMVRNTTIDGYAIDGNGKLVQSSENNDADAKSRKTNIESNNCNASKNTSSITNEYYSNTPQVLTNVVNITPRHVYYQDGSLVMEAYVYNGFNHSIWSIGNAKIAISTSENVIASAHFNSLDGLKIGGNNYAIWTFHFPKDCVYDQNANLNTLKWESSVNYNY